MCLAVLLTWRIFTAPSLCGRVLELVLLCASYFLNCSSFFCAPGQMNVLPVPLTIPPHCHLQHQAWRVPLLMCLCLSCCSLLPLFFCCAKAVQLAFKFFFRNNCSINRCDLLCSMEEVSSMTSYIAILDWNPCRSCFFYPFIYSFDWRIQSTYI